MSNRSSQIKPAKLFIGTHLRQIYSRCTEYGELGTYIKSLLPDSFAQLIAWVSSSNQQLTIYCTSTGAASKLRFMEADLLEAIANRQDSLHITSIRYRLATTANQTIARQPPRKPAQLTPKSRKLILDTAKAISDQKLSEALKRLATTNTKDT